MASIKSYWAGFGEITKTVERDDGSITVSGVCSTEDRDSDGETISAAAMKRAIPEFMKYPAIREMHSPSAVGTALAMSVDKAGKTWIEARIVDPIAIKKVREKVYRGFSVGGRVPPGGRDPEDPTKIRALTLVEVSLVDRPANVAARIEYVKRERAATILLDRALAKAEGLDPSVRDLILQAMRTDTQAPTRKSLPAWYGPSPKLGGPTVEPNPRPAVEPLDPADPASVPRAVPSPHPAEPVAVADRSDPAASDGSKGHADPAPPSPHTCPTCGSTLKCQSCHATAEPEKMAKIASDLDLAKRERDGALRKVAALERERDSIRKRMDVVEKRAVAAETERDAANGELRKRAKGALLDVSRFKAADKASDVEGHASVEQPPDDALGLIKKAHAAPAKLAADFGPLLPRGR